MKSIPFLIALLVMGKSASLLTGATRPEPPPNIILIVSDDQGFSDLGAFGGQEFRTPTLDRLAREGVRGTNFYVTAGNCTPSRSGLITGRYPQRNGLYDMVRNDLVNYGHRYTLEDYAVSPEMTRGLDVREKTFGDLLKSAGYTNAAFGKWDMGQARRFLPLQRGFDTFYGHGNNGIDYYTHERYGIHSMFQNNVLTKKDQGMYATELFRREAVAFMRENRERPFFIYLPFNAPHGASNLEKDSHQVPAAYLKKYYPERDPEETRTKYLGMVSAMDEAIGEILATLAELRLDRNTLVLFFSDNGRAGCHFDGQPLRGGKRSPFEGGLRSPFLAWWPGVIPAGRVTDEFLTSLEVFPTLAAASGAFLPDVRLDGFDMLPVLKGEMPSPRQEMFWEGRYYRAARVGHWKWIYDSGGGRKAAQPVEGLYDLSTDVSETHDLSREKPEVLAMVKGRFERWKAEMNAAEPRGPFRNH